MSLPSNPQRLVTIDVTISTSVVTRIAPSQTLSVNPRIYLDSIQTIQFLQSSITSSIIADSETHEIQLFPSVTSSISPSISSKIFSAIASSSPSITLSSSTHQTIEIVKSINISSTTLTYPLELYKSQAPIIQSATSTVIRSASASLTSSVTPSLSTSINLADVYVISSAQLDSSTQQFLEFSITSIVSPSIFTESWYTASNQTIIVSTSTETHEIQLFPSTQAIITQQPVTQIYPELPILLNVQITQLYRLTEQYLHNTGIQHITITVTPLTEIKTTITRTSTTQPCSILTLASSILNTHRSIQTITVKPHIRTIHANPWLIIRRRSQ